jgi:hypothetical protein
VVKTSSKARPRTTKWTMLAGVKPISGKIRAAVACVDCDKPRLLCTQISLDTLFELTG